MPTQSSTIFLRWSVYLMLFLNSLPDAQVRCEDREIRIGAVLALTGDFAAANRAFFEGMELAAGEVNRQPIWNGRKIRMVVEDGEFLPKPSFDAFKKLITIDRVTAVISGSAIETKAGASLINAAKVPTMTLWDASPRLEALGGPIFSIGLWTPSSGEVAALYTLQSLAKRRAFIFNSEDEWSLELENAFREKLHAGGGQVAGAAKFRPDESDFRSALLKARQSGAETLYVTVTYNIPAFFKQLRELRWKVPVVTSDIVSDSLLKDSPSLYDGIYQTQIYTPVSPKTAHLLQLYRVSYKRECDRLPWVAWGYDALHLLAEAISHVGPDRKSIASYLAEVKNFNGASGDITMVGRSSPRRPAVFQVSAGRFVLTR